MGTLTYTGIIFCRLSRTSRALSIKHKKQKRHVLVILFVMTHRKSALYFHYDNKIVRISIS